MFVYDLTGCGLESSCGHLNCKFRACFEQGVPEHSGNYRVWVHSETRAWHDRNIQSYTMFMVSQWIQCKTQHKNVKSITSYRESPLRQEMLNDLALMHEGWNLSQIFSKCVDMFHHETWQVTLIFPKTTTTD